MAVVPMIARRAIKIVAWLFVAVSCSLRKTWHSADLSGAFPPLSFVLARAADSRQGFGAGPGRCRMLPALSPSGPFVPSADVWFKSAIGSGLDIDARRLPHLDLANLDLVDLDRSVRALVAGA